MADPVSATGTGSNGFFSIFESALGAAVDAGKSVLPRFFEQELIDQKSDQLSNPTYNQANSPYGNSQYGTIQKAGLLFDNINVSSTGLIVAAVAVVGVVVLLKVR